MNEDRDVMDLKSAWDAEGMDYHVGGNAERIILRNDGKGPNGWYDRIHIYLKHTHAHMIFPAHMMSSWVET